MEKTQILDALKTIDYRVNRIAFLFYWLEDINWHTEARQIAEAAGDQVNNLENDLSALRLVALKNTFTAQHWNGIKDSLHATYSEDQLDHYLAKIRSEVGVAMENGFITWRLFRDYTKAVELAYSLPYFSGWGTNLKMDDFNELLAECDKMDEENRRVASSYNMD